MTDYPQHKITDAIGCFFDVLGTSETKSLADIEDLLQATESSIIKADYFFSKNKATEAAKKDNPWEYSPHLCWMFSDNIFYLAQNNDAYGNEGGFYSLAHIVSLFQFYMLERGYLVRGGISTGNAAFSDKSVLGTALTNSYAIEEGKTLGKLPGSSIALSAQLKASVIEWMSAYSEDNKKKEASQFKVVAPLTHATPSSITILDAPRIVTKLMYGEIEDAKSDVTDPRFVAFKNSINESFTRIAAELDKLSYDLKMQNQREKWLWTAAQYLVTLRDFPDLNGCVQFANKTFNQVDYQRIRQLEVGFKPFPVP